MAKNNNIVVNPNVINQICIETEITGNIITKGDIRIDGVLTGNLTTSGKLVLGETGRIHGEINCVTGHISGVIEGKIINKELLSLKSTASITGEIFTEKLAIEPGAKFSGTCNMDSNNKPYQDFKQEPKVEKTN